MDQVAIEFDVHQLSEAMKRQTLNFHGAGINEVGSDFNYDLSNDYLKSSGRKYELRFRIKLAPDEDAN